MALRIPRNKNSGQTVGRYREEEQTIFEGRVNGGIVTAIDSADIENNQFSSLVNCRVRYDKTEVRDGLRVFTPAKPDSNKVLLLTPYARFSGVVSLIRATSTTIYSGTSAAWNAVVWVLSGGTNDRFRTVITNDRFFFSNNGADYIQELNPAALTFARAGNAPKYRYITAFNNRLIGANFVDAVSPNPVLVGWSGDLVFTEWDPLVNISAGSSPLIDAPTNYADPITGIFGFTENALLLRERSLYGISKQPVATSPFNFFVIAPAIGCDSPYSAVSIRNGIAWFDFRTGCVYAYTIGMQEPERIGTPVEKDIVSQVTDVTTIFASYNTVEEEYTLCLPSPTSTLVKCWTFNFKTKAWTYDELYNVSSISDIDYSSSTLVIDDLSGMIDDLTGTIDALSNNVAIASRFIGQTNGDIWIQDPLVYTDGGGATVSATVISKTFQVPRHPGYVTQLALDYIPSSIGTMTFYYTKDGGVTWNLYRAYTTLAGDLGKRKSITLNKHIRADQYKWKLVTTAKLKILEYEVHAVMASSDSRSR